MIYDAFNKSINKCSNYANYGDPDEHYNTGCNLLYNEKKYTESIWVYVRFLIQIYKYLSVFLSNFYVKLLKYLKKYLI